MCSKKTHKLWRGVLFTVIAAELLLAFFFAVRLPIRVRPVQLDFTEIVSVELCEEIGTWPANTLLLDDPDEIARWCVLVNAVRAPRERQPERYQTIMGGACYSLIFTRADGSTTSVSVLEQTPLLFVGESAKGVPAARYYCAGEAVVGVLCTAMDVALHPAASFDD